METRIAPQWIRDTEERYERGRIIWMCTTALGWIGWFGWWVLFLRSSKGAMEGVLMGGCLLGWFASDFLKPEIRAQRYGAAVSALNAAIVRWEVSSDLPDSALIEADRRARETLRSKRIRIAPAWIRNKRRRYRLNVLAWASPALLPLVVFPATLLLRWPLGRVGQTVFPLLLFFLLLLGAGFRTRRLREARDILAEAIQRYEFESVHNEVALDEADRRASAALMGNSLTQ